MAVWVGGCVLCREEYFSVKLQWRSMSAEQERRWRELRDRKCLIEKDVLRTDRDQPYFTGANNPNLLVLNDGLLTYTMFHYDLGIQFFCIFILLLRFNTLRIFTYGFVFLYGVFIRLFAIHASKLVIISWS